MRPCYDGDPFMFWTFVKSFDSHIAVKMSNDAARFVYMPKHLFTVCEARAGTLLRNKLLAIGLLVKVLSTNMGSLILLLIVVNKTLKLTLVFNLVLNFRLKTKDFNGLKDLLILMKKCLSIMEDIKDFEFSRYHSAHNANALVKNAK